jgi:hypothetical protein
MKNLKIISNTKEIGIKYVYYIMSELEIINGNKNLICCFGGMALKMGGIPPFEFLNYLLFLLFLYDNNIEIYLCKILNRNSWNILKINLNVVIIKE